MLLAFDRLRIDRQWPADMVVLHEDVEPVRARDLGYRILVIHHSKTVGNQFVKNLIKSHTKMEVLVLLPYITV